MDQFLESASGSLTQATKLLVRKAVTATTASCDGITVSTPQGNPRHGLIPLHEDPNIPQQMLPRSGMQTSTGARELMFRMTWEESREKTVAYNSH